MIESAPINDGLGSVLVRRSVEGQFGGTISYDWNSDGLTVHISVPLERLLN